MSNLKQIGLGVMMYVQDYDEKYPHCVEVLSGTTYYWQQFISSYTSHYDQRTQLYRCPSSYLTLRGGVYYDFKPGGYAANRAVLIDGDAGGSGANALFLSALASPATTYMIMDGGDPRISAYNAYTPSANGLYYIPGSKPFVSAPTGTWSSYAELENDFKWGRHLGGVNVLFADGHVKWLQSQLLANQARLCGSGSCFPISNSTAKSAWNPLVGGQ
jgi:prepilin-type processing-associated H-X9-DG protein